MVSPEFIIGCKYCILCIFTSKLTSIAPEPTWCSNYCFIVGRLDNLEPVGPC